MNRWDLLTDVGAVVDRLGGAERAARALGGTLRAAFGATSCYGDAAEASAEARAAIDGEERRLPAVLGHASDGVASRDGDPSVEAWIGGIVHSPHLWELHPLAVHPSVQGRGHGRRLVRALEDQARSAGATTIFLGTEDETGATNLFGTDPLDDVAGALARFRLVVAEHPIAFYGGSGIA